MGVVLCFKDFFISFFFLGEIFSVVVVLRYYFFLWVCKYKGNRGTHFIGVLLCSLKQQIGLFCPVSGAENKK